jgi:DNA-binding NtrC family response regulator
MNKKQMKKQVLFVDDEPNILEGYQRMLRPLRGEWDTHYAMSGTEALEMMNAIPIDLIIADIRMPEMDGVELLGVVMKHHPNTIRMVFSGNADSELTMKAADVADKFISKPCDPETLRSIVGRALNLEPFTSP